MLEPCATCPHLEESPEQVASYHRHLCHESLTTPCIGHLQGEAKCTERVKKSRTLYIIRNPGVAKTE